MKKTQPLLILLLLATTTTDAQTWVAGDTTGKHYHLLQQDFKLREAIAFDIDCDGIKDLELSAIQYPPPNNYVRLNMTMADSVMARINNNGHLDTYTTGNTMYLAADSLWTRHKDFIYGTGGAGSYGQHNILHKYIGFRKRVKGQSQYLFLLFSNQQVNFTIHHIISDCPINPLYTLGAGIQPWVPSLSISPNPTSSFVRFSLPPQELRLYNNSGQLVLAPSTPSTQINIAHLPAGCYLMTFRSGKGQESRRITKY